MTNQQLSNLFPSYKLTKDQEAQFLIYQLEANWIGAESTQAKSEIANKIKAIQNSFNVKVCVF